MDKETFRKIERQRRIEYHKTIDQLDIDADLLHQWLMLSKDLDLAGKIIAGYHPQGSELDITALLEFLSSQGHYIVLPLKDEIGFDLAPDIVFVPGLAFDDQGNRLGQGKGYYDQALMNLSKTKEIIAIGMGYECQKLDNIPVCDMDYTMNYILTPASFIRVQK